MSLGLWLLAALVLSMMVIDTSISAESVPVEAVESLPPPLPASVDLNPVFEEMGLNRRRQGPRGTCSVFTVTGGLEYAVAKATGNPVRLSVEFLNWAGHEATGRRVDGGFFHELWNGYVKHGICPESDLPYRERFDEDLTPSDEALRQAESLRSLGLKLEWIKEWNPKNGLTDAQLHQIKVQLSEGWPVLGGFRWPHRENWIEGVLEMRSPEEVFDGHSVLLIGYRDDPKLPGGGAFLIRNSGGSGNDGWMPYGYVREYMNDAAWIEAPKKTKADE